MADTIQAALIEKIRSYRRIILSRHLRPDGDAVGGTLGFKRVLSLSFPEKEVYVINGDYSEDMAFLGSEDRQLPDELYKEALVIVLDTGSADRISNPKYAMGRELMVIDHHIERHPYGDIAWVEPDRSSLCEMLAALCAAFPQTLHLNAQAATCLYAGMVTDSGRFKYESVTGETLRLAAMLLDTGVDMQTLYAHLYLDEYRALKFHAYVLNRMQLTTSGVAHFFISQKAQASFGLTSEEACNAISYLGGLKDSLIWIAFIENPDGTIRVRLRSRFVTVNELAEAFGGGGHACASGATLDKRSRMRPLLRQADALLEAYKAEHTGWM